MAEEKKEEKKEGKSCCCASHDGAAAKCCCKYKKYFPHNWFKLKCLTHIFYAFFYLGIIASVYMFVQLVQVIPYVKNGMLTYGDLAQMISLVLTVIVFTFVMLAVAKICKVLRKIKHIVKECKEADHK